MFAISADGVDFKMWERQHPDFPYDSKAISHNFRSCGAKYIIALAVFESKCVFIEGPFRGGKHDLDMFRESGLMKKMKDNGKVCIADRGLRSKKSMNAGCLPTLITWIPRSLVTSKQELAYDKKHSIDD